MEYPDLALLNRCLSYDPETGRLTWKERPGRKGTINPGDEAGTPIAGGHRQIRILGRLYKAHRIIWLMMTGEEPVGVVDHINGDPQDNRWENLRLASIAENSRNSRHRTNSASPLKGASFNNRDKRWVAQITVNRKYHHLGMFDTAEEAHEAYKRAAERLHGEFARSS